MSEQTNNSKKVQWGVLGAARILRRTLPALKASRNAELRGIASRDMERAKEAAVQWGAAQAFPTYEALLTDPQIEAVYIPLPNAMHKPWIIRAVEAGKHVLCEKPLALTVEEVQEVEEAAKQHKRLVMEAFMYRFHPQQARVRELLASGAIGDLRMIRATNAFTLAGNNYNIRLDSDMGGGATWDVGCYGINVARWMMGAEPERVWAEATIQHGVDSSVVAVLEFENGKRAVLDYSLDYGRRSFYELIGRSGSLSVENMWQEADTPGAVYVRTDQAGLKTEEVPVTNHFQLQIEAFSQAILNGEPAPYPLSDTAANTRVCQAVLEAIHSKQVVRLD